MGAADITTQAHVCNFCLKAYRRRDLLLRHRRRCQGPKKPATRRKACITCAQAKAKCTYSRPCQRCATRGVPCEYESVPPPSDAQALGLDLDLDLVEDLAIFAGSMPFAGVVNTQSSQVGRSAQEAPAGNSTSMSNPMNLDESAKTTVDSLHIGNPFSRATFGAWEDPRADVTLRPFTLEELTQVLEQYPNLLVRDDFISPILHRLLYDEEVPNMTTLAHTSMAVCCGSAMETAHGARFARQAMDMERQRLIQNYPTYSCMQQWDALHAMVVYGILELRVSYGTGKDSWKQKVHSKGLKAPFLVKMTQVFIQSHNSTPDLSLLSANDSSLNFERWNVAETARRTIFLANILHFLSHHDPNTGSRLPYYEPLDDELILNMPLPCSHALWSARTEQEWRLTIEYGAANLDPTIHDLSTAFHLVPSYLTLKNLLENFSSDFLTTIVTLNFGFGGSDELRSFIVLCALLQFPGKQNQRHPPF
ncbi:hypothetical protein N7462_009641 [Penicillium macrosclerotiorum]|uniref:uncharacterized protein n=1 Tax=Penicillium macrosclerotiorum TaxID=303699 RepID=UPI002548F3D5|nr:uncharacterized protein N7462_009641 [Penicillium macrosclerotiorum]KAJ5674202.1 hypothetical protein N7462_009641 [Penicillium macrosclerotiorum]